MKPLAGGGRAVVLFNCGDAPAWIGFSNEMLNFPATLRARIRDLWAHRDVGIWKGRYEAEIEPHGVVMLRLDP